MQATSLRSHVFLSKPLSREHKVFSNVTTPRRSLICASKSDSFGHHYEGKMVDDNMILLRMRIREIETLETKGKDSSDWNEWEKKYFQNYDSDVCEAVGVLQRVLMNTRPSFALATFALLMLTTSMSMLQLAFHLVGYAKGIL
ncbi:uncharacterized protein LOC124834671 [Vigna umbellata]|uniref:uncharacterized protein LOC124834671 n=1 Tax=Vigna umbellata TaxID=87088 RepID=UPI001F5FDE89|nr:uncharacterized protein LOC124834671 [Vigna umbellata]